MIALGLLKKSRMTSPSHALNFINLLPCKVTYSQVLGISTGSSLKGAIVLPTICIFPNANYCFSRSQKEKEEKLGLCPIKKAKTGSFLEVVELLEDLVCKPRV